MEEGKARLKPCPFCADDAVDVGTLDSGGWTAECGNCGASSGVFATADEARDAWNIRRPTEDSSHE